jgi:hypothetical protein
VGAHFSGRGAHTPPTKTGNFWTSPGGALREGRGFGPKEPGFGRAGWLLDGLSAELKKMNVLSNAHVPSLLPMEHMSR